MIRIDKGIRPEEIRQNGRHVLFVEGRDKNSLDPQIVGELFDGMIRIEPFIPNVSKWWTWRATCCRDKTKSIKL
jgi:hypothetical protein